MGRQQLEAPRRTLNYTEDGDSERGEAEVGGRGRLVPVVQCDGDCPTGTASAGLKHGEGEGDGDRVVEW